MIESIRTTYHDVNKQSLWTVITVVVIGYVGHVFGRVFF